MIGPAIAGCTRFAPAAAALMPLPAFAHIKWFEPYDITQQPLDPDEVLNPTFIWFFVISAVLIYIFFFVDRFIFRRGIFAALDQRMKMFDSIGIGIMRAAGGV
jgi:hypothetical protein